MSTEFDDLLICRGCNQPHSYQQTNAPGIGAIYLGEGVGVDPTAGWAEDTQDSYMNYSTYLAYVASIVLVFLLMFSKDPTDGPHAEPRVFSLEQSDSRYTFMLLRGGSFTDVANDPLDRCIL